MAHRAHDDHPDDLVTLLADGRRCPQCDLALDAGALDVSQDNARLITLRLRCARCGCDSSVSIAIARDVALSAELSPDEAFHFSSASPLAETDITRMRALLRAHHGDLLDLLGHDPDPRNA
jgi:hypothetical protein